MGDEMEDLVVGNALLQLVEAKGSIQMHFAGIGAYGICCITAMIWGQASAMEAWTLAQAADL